MFLAERRDERQIAGRWTSDRRTGNKQVSQEDLVAVFMSHVRQAPETRISADAVRNTIRFPAKTAISVRHYSNIAE